MATATDVSIRPRSSVNPVARRRVLVDVTVEIGPEFLVIDSRRTFESGNELLRGDELAPLVRTQLTDRLAVPGHDEVLPSI